MAVPNLHLGCVVKLVNSKKKNNLLVGEKHYGKISLLGSQCLWGSLGRKEFIEKRRNFRWGIDGIATGTGGPGGTIRGPNPQPLL